MGAAGLESVHATPCGVSGSGTGDSQAKHDAEAVRAADRLDGQVAENVAGRADEFGSQFGREPVTDSQLARIVAAWPTLPEAIRAGIVAMVRAAGGVS